MTFIFIILKYFIKRAEYLYLNILASHVSNARSLHIYFHINIEFMRTFLKDLSLQYGPLKLDFASLFYAMRADEGTTLEADSSAVQKMIDTRIIGKK